MRLNTKTYYFYKNDTLFTTFTRTGYEGSAPCIASKSNIVYICDSDNGLMRSTDFGQSFQTVNNAKFFGVDGGNTNVSDNGQHLCLINDTRTASSFPSYAYVSNDYGETLKQISISSRGRARPLRRKVPFPRFCKNGRITLKPQQWHICSKIVVV